MKKQKNISGFLLLLFLSFSESISAETTIFSARSQWLYWDRGDLGTAAWTTRNYDDSSWIEGFGGLAYNDDTQISTTLSSTDTNGDKLLTAYFRRSFILTNVASLVTMRVDLRRDDGAVIYLNGTEVLRENMPTGTITYSTLAASTIDGPEEDTFVSRILDLSGVSLIEGTNSMAVEVHQRKISSSDLIFDLALYTSSNSIPVFNSDPIQITNIVAETLYTNQLASYVTNPGGDPLTFKKLGGPSWLHIAPNGNLSGTPPAWMADQLNTFSVQVSNGDGGDTASMQITPTLPSGYSQTRRYRLTWADDPSTTATIGWEQTQGTNAIVLYDLQAHHRDPAAYAFTQTVTRVGHFSQSGNLYTRFAALTNLQPDTLYYFILKDANGSSPELFFRTAPNIPAPFTFVAGGDSRSNPEPRRDCNRLVAKLRPLFIAFTGDMTSSDKTPDWNHWLDDWQETISADGRIYPILPHLGNHEERKNGEIDEIFDIPPQRYYAITIGGNLLRYYVLNTEVEQGGSQTDWLTNNLHSASNIIHKVAGYHRPMCSHVASKSDNIGAYTNWAQPFFDYGVELAIEADSHCAKRTWPVEPVGLGNGEDGFVRNNTNGTVYVGEGCWGAPLRTPDNAKSWTAATGKFYGFQWVHVYSDYIELFTPQAKAVAEVKALQEGHCFSIPAGLRIWSPASGARIVIRRNKSGSEKISYAQWQINQWGLPLPAKCAMVDDFDSDGLSNLEEFSFGLDPADPAQPDSSQGTVFPHISSSNTILLLRYRRRKNMPISFWYESSTNLLAGWSEMLNGRDFAETASVGASNETVQVRLSENFVHTNTISFIRLRCGIR